MNRYLKPQVTDGRIVADSETRAYAARVTSVHAWAATPEPAREAVPVPAHGRTRRREDL